jgi:hypothetical protein
VQNDSPRPIGTASPVQDGTLSAAPNLGSRSAADGTPPAASSGYVGKRHPNIISKANIDDLMQKFGLSFDAACTALYRGSV